MQDEQDRKCKGHQLCKRDVVADERCQLHLPIDHGSKIGCTAFDEVLHQELTSSTASKMGIYELHWESLIFPKGHRLFQFGIFEDVKEKLKDTWVTLAGSDIQDIDLGSYSFRYLILSDSTIYGDTLIGVTDIGRLSLQEAIFHGNFHCASRSREIDAKGAEFQKDFSFASTVSERAIFAGCRFKSSCVFHASAGQTFGNGTEGEFQIVGFDNSIFEKPDQTLFKDVDLTKASFKSVSLVGVRFYNTLFYQKELGRNGLFNEVKEYNRRKVTPSIALDYTTLNRYGYIIQEYRQLRMAMETSKDYDKSHDFYVGEMEARQRTRRNAILDLYRTSSLYGTNYYRAFGILALLFLLHFLLTIIFSTNLQFLKLFDQQYAIAAWSRLGEIALHSLSTGSLQKVGLLETIGGLQKLVDIVFRLLIPIQTAMLVLAIRNKTKR